MKQHLTLLTICILLFYSLRAQESVEPQDTLAEREIVKLRFINSEGKSAAGFRVNMLPENVEGVTDDIGYVELDSSTKNEYLYAHNPYRTDNSWRWKITFSPGDKDTIHTLIIDHWYMEGCVVDSENSPVRDVNVEVVGQDKSAVTNWDGKFLLKNVSKGDVLRFIDPNKLYLDKEVRVVFSSETPQYKLSQYVPAVFASRKDTAGVMFISDQTPRNKGAYVPDISNIKSFNRKGDEYAIKEFKNKEYLSGAEVQYTSDVGISRVGRLPELQTDDFFRTGVSFKNGLDIKSAFIANSVLSADFSQNRINTPIPDASREAYKGGVSINRLKIGNFTSEAGFAVSSAYDKMINSGGNYARLLHAVYTNPHYTVSQLADSEDIDNLLAYAKMKYKLKKLELEGIFSFNEQESNRTIYDATANSFTRNAELSNLNAGLNASYKLNDKINFKASYLFDKNKESYDYVNLSLQENDDLSRQSHQVSYAMTFVNRIIHIDLANKHYFSNTANDYTNLFPSAGFNLHLNELTYKLFDETWGFFRDLRLFASASRSLGEAPLLYKNKAVLSTNLHSSQFAEFYETKEIPFNDMLKPEIYMNTEFGLRKYLLNDKLFLEAVYFHNTTNDFIAPHLHSSNSAILENVGKVRNYGGLFSANYYFGKYYRDFRGSIGFNFNLMRNKVLEVYHNNEAIALAGFSNIQTVFAENEPLGAIYGTSYQRNADGQLIIGDDGFPLIDSQLKKIGDPTPDFRMSLTPSLTWKFLTFSTVMEYSRGGDRWNGTKAYLDYADMSQETAEQRNIKDVGEAYIEDASYFRLTEIALACNLGRIIKLARSYSVIKNLEVGTRLNNLLLITPYKGVEPESNLFGCTTGKGLDLFNMPSSRSFNFYVNIKL